MKWLKDPKQISDAARVPIKSWCGPIEPQTLDQARNLAEHPAVKHHVALMPDAHLGYGMPIGGVIGCTNVVIPNAVGVDIGCGMCAVQTDLSSDNLKEMRRRRELIESIKSRIPVGEGHGHKEKQSWSGFENFLSQLPPSEKTDWLDDRGWHRDHLNLGTLGGGNHFIEIQEGDDGVIWLMLHSGSRNLGYRIASHHHTIAKEINKKAGIALPNAQLAYLQTDTPEGKAYIRDMTFALEYARESRRRMMASFKDAFIGMFPQANFCQKINIHHNYAAEETHFGELLWVHRKGATSAHKEELGIIPGSMGTPSYIVRGRGNEESFMSCSHGAGRTMGRAEASRKLTLEQCNDAMEGIVYDRWQKKRGKFGKKKKKAAYDFGEAPLAYKNIENVISAESDLITPLVKLKPLAVVKG